MTSSKTNQANVLNQIKKQFGGASDPLESILSSISDHVSLIDRDFTILWANKTVFRQFGKDVIGKKCFEVFQGQKGPCEPFPCHTRKAFEDNETHFAEKKAISASGNEIFFHITADPAVKDENGNTLAVLEISRDITLQKMFQKELEKSEEKYRKLFEDSNDGIIIHHLDGKIVNANIKAIKQFGYTPEEFMGLNIKDLHPEAMLKKSKRAFKKIQESGNVNFEIDFIKKNKKVFAAEVSSSMFDVADMTFIQGIVRDITKRKKVEKEKQKLIKELNNALDEVKQLSGLLPICSYCKKIRDDDGYWKQLESYISKHSDIQFSHGICKDCIKKHYPDFDK